MENGAPYVRHILRHAAQSGHCGKVPRSHGPDLVRTRQALSRPPGALFLISNTYPGVWLEHVYDAVCWARLEPSMAYVARSQVRLFLENQKEDGQLRSEEHTSELQSQR